jgi:hypothetical protein
MREGRLPSVAHSCFTRSRSRARHRVIVRGRRPGNRRTRLGHRRPGRALDLPPEITRVRGRFREHTSSVLQLLARHAVAPEDHAPARVFHGDIERAVALHAPKLAQCADERRIRHPETGRATSRTAGRESTDEGDTQRQSGAYHAGKARYGAREGQRGAVLTLCGQKSAFPTAYRQRMGTDTADSALGEGIGLAMLACTMSYVHVDNVP